MGNEYAVAEKWGINRKLSLTETCADFYALELMSSDGSVDAKRSLATLERTVAPMFRRYIDMVCGGELRHMGSVDEDEGHSMWDCDSCSDCWEWCDDCNEHHISCEGECNEDHSAPHACNEDKWKWDDGCPQCDSYDECGCHCECGHELTCNYSPMLKKGQEPILGERLTRFFGEYQQSYSGGRTGAWDWWLTLRKEDIEHTMPRDAAKWFVEGEWVHGFGGRGWATGAKAVYDSYTGKIKDRTFIDRCWTLQHNNGRLFDKLFDVDGLYSVLETQANNDYDRLTLKYSSKPVRELWREHKVSQRDEYDPIWLGR